MSNFIKNFKIVNIAFSIGILIGGILVMSRKSLIDMISNKIKEVIDYE